MADILILKCAQPDYRSGAYNAWRALQALPGDDHYFLESYGDLIFTIQDGVVRCGSVTSGRDLASYDLVYIRDLGYEYERYALGLYLEHNHRRFINPEATYFQHRSKLTQYIALAFAGIPVPDTFYVQRRQVGLLVEQFTLPFPLVMKAVTGSRGRDNILVKDREDLAANALPRAVLQPFIPNDFDYRIVIGGNEVLVAYKRMRAKDTDDHRNNVARGGQRILVERLPADVRDLAIRAARVVRRDLAGVDILTDKDTGRSVVLEVNFNFGMAQTNDAVAAAYYPQFAAYLHGKATT